MTLLSEKKGEKNGQAYKQFSEGYKPFKKERVECALHNLTMMPSIPTWLCCKFVE